MLVAPECSSASVCDSEYGSLDRLAAGAHGLGRHRGEPVASSRPVDRLRSLAQSSAPKRCRRAALHRREFLAHGLLAVSCGLAPFQAGAQPVSQPPTPQGSLPVMKAKL